MLEWLEELAAMISSRSQHKTDKEISPRAGHENEFSSSKNKESSIRCDRASGCGLLLVWLRRRLALSLQVGGGTRLESRAATFL